jgi:hypothetical protein
MRRIWYALFVTALAGPMVGFVAYMVSRTEARWVALVWGGVLVAYCLGLRSVWRALFGPIPEEESRFERQLADWYWRPVRTARQLRRRRTPGSGDAMDYRR